MLFATCLVFVINLSDEFFLLTNTIYSFITFSRICDESIRASVWIFLQNIVMKYYPKKDSAFVYPRCSKRCKNAGGLATHMKTHARKEPESPTETTNRIERDQARTEASQVVCKTSSKEPTRKRTGVRCEITAATSETTEKKANFGTKPIYCAIESCRI